MAVPPRILDASWKDSWRVEWPIVLATDFFSAYPLAQQHWGGKNQESIKDQPNMFTFVQFKLSQLEGRRFSNLVKLVFQEWILFEWQISATDGTVHSWHVVDPRLLPTPLHGQFQVENVTFQYVSPSSSSCLSNLHFTQLSFHQRFPRKFWMFYTFSRGIPHFVALKWKVS